MIPKKLHYCWFGRNEKPALTKRCIESWKKYLPDYEIIEWNEDNFDVNCNEFVKRNYLNKHYANVSDFVRVYALYSQGGLYLDTDCEVIKNLDEFLSNDAFIGIEMNYMATSLFGAVAGHSWVERILNYYNGITYESGGNEENTSPNIFSLISADYGFKKENIHQTLSNGVRVYPTEYFSPKNYCDFKVKLTNNSHAIHHFNASWFGLEARNKFLENHIVGLLKTIDELTTENILLKNYISKIKKKNNEPD